MTHEASLRKRPDLIMRQIWFGNRQVWVIRDPLARQWFYVEEHQHAMLMLADGTRTLREIAHQVSQSMPMHYFAPESVLYFFAEVQKQGLLMQTSPVAVSEQSNGSRWYRQPLAIRFPGVAPGAFLDWMDRWVNVIWSARALLAAILVIMMALTIATIYSSAMARDFVRASKSFQATDMWTVLFVIAGTKIVHELAHAVACRRMGADVREIGVMLLCGAPCLYCDVSDAWMLPTRVQRIIVSAAGVFAEWLLASIAVFVWWIANDSIVRDFSLIFIGICSLSTLLVNANPLLRYDGYFILSDLVGIPNLSQSSTTLLMETCRRWLWGIPRSTSALAIGAERTLFLAVYGILSLLYRTFVIGLILAAVYQFADSHAIRQLAMCGLILLVGAIIWRTLSLIAMPPDRALRRTALTPQRPAIVACCLGVASFIVLFIPIPRTMDVPMWIEPANRQNVFAPGDGELKHVSHDGMMLNEGDLVVVLSNRKLELEIAQQKTQCDKLLAELNALQKLRTVASDDSAKVATLQEQRKDAQERLELLQADMQRLSMRASRASRVYSPPEVRMTSFRETDVRAWTGTLLDPANAGVSLRKGTWICMLGDAVKREAVLVVPSSDIEAVRPGQSVTLRLAGWPSGSVRGKVALVSESPMSGGGEEWIPDSLRKNQAPATAYRVLVTIDEGSPALQVRMVGRASIRVQARSLWWRATRTFWDWFG